MSRYCLQCGKANKACICQWIQSIDAKTQLCILQHPSEVKQPIGTARILTLSIPGTRLWVGEDFTTHTELNHWLNEPGYQVFILYPGEGSQPITRCVTSPEDSAVKQRLILLDGTWKKAFKMWQLSTNLQQLPMLHLDNVEQGNYRIRKSPKAGGVSTVEAGYLALGALEQDYSRFSPLIDTFNNMIDFQIQQMPPGVFERNY